MENLKDCYLICGDEWMKNEYQILPLEKCVEEMFIGPFGSSLKNEHFVDKAEAYCMVYEQKHAIQKSMDVETRYINLNKYNELQRFNVRGGDIIVSCRGTIGETYIVPEDAPLGIMHPSIMKIRLKEGIYDKKYFNLLLRICLQKHQTQANGSGIKMAISAKELGKELFSVPPLSEQKEISEIFENLYSLIKMRKQQLYQFENLIKSRFVEMFGDIQHEEKYQGIPLREICTTVSGGTPSTKFPEYYEGDIPWISTVSLGPNHIDGTTAKGYITEDAIANSATKLIPANNILFGTRVGVGKSSLNDVDICTNQDIVAITGIDETKFSRLFIKHVLDSYQPYFDSIKKGATILGITSDDLKDSLIPQVSIDIQKEYELFVEQADKLKSTIQKSLDKTQLLFNSLMQQYFG